MSGKIVGSGYGGSSTYDRSSDSSEINQRSSVYQKVASGGGVYWPVLTEEERYGIWTLHLERGGKFMDYVEFCTVMDSATK